jgi:hypothetical protein
VVIARFTVPDFVTQFPRFTGESRYPRLAWIPAFRRESTLFNFRNFTYYSQLRDQDTNRTTTFN